MLTSVSMHQIIIRSGLSSGLANAHGKNPDVPSSSALVTHPQTNASIQAEDLDKLKAIASLKARDKEVRAHEQAHIAASGGLAMGGASFTYQQGPDGNRYAIGGEVQIDTLPVVGDPSATLTHL